LGEKEVKNPGRWIARALVLSLWALIVGLLLKIGEIAGFSWWWLAILVAICAALLYLTCCILGSRGENDSMIVTTTSDRQRTVVFLFVCSANVARSATAEHLARQGRCLADSAGSDSEVAVRRLTVETIARARRIICMEEEHAQAVLRLAPERAKDITIWNIPDNYHYCEPALMAEIRERLQPLIEQWHYRRYLFLGPGGEEFEEQ
jgi:predicted protein tyrosine phosphatase